MSSWFEDRSWMYNRQCPGGGVTKVFKNGVENFLNYCFSHEEDMQDGKIVCPCSKCCNRYFKNRNTVLKHLYVSGFRPCYYVWIFHGEKDNPNISSVVPDSAQAGSSNTNNVMSESMNFHDLFVDLADGEVGIELSSDDSSNDMQDEEEPNTDAKTFYDMLMEEQQQLYDGCFTSPLFATAEFLKIKADRSVSINTFNAFVSVTKWLLPEKNTLPSSYRESEMLFKKLGLQLIKIDACPNDCMLYYKEAAKWTECPTCHTNRFVEVTTSSGTKTPNKTLRYMPIAARLQRLFMSQKTASQMRWHHESAREEGVMTHPCHGQAWKSFDTSFPDFAAEPRNVRIGLCTDGFTPFGHSARSYSIWPVMVVVYNLPPWLCMTKPFIYMPLLIPGRSSPAQNIDVYLRPLIDELKTLWEDGIVTWDVSKRQNFTMRVALMWTIGDFPAYGMLSGWSTHGKFACPICMENTKAFTLRFGGKPCWFDCHRRHLNPEHPFRFESDQFTKGRIETSPPPIRVPGFQLEKRIRRLPPNRFGYFMRSNERYDGFGDSHNWRKRSIFWELPYWAKLPIRHVLDLMHIEKNFFDNLFYTTIGSKDKRNKDNIKARKDVAIVCSRRSLHLRERNGKFYKPKASYTLSPSDVRILCAWLKMVKFPDGYAGSFSNCVNQEGNGVEGLKSHDCHVFMQRLLPIALRGFIPENLWKTITELCNFFKDITAPTLYLNHVCELEQDISFILCKLEKIYPPGFFDSMEHLTVHLPEEARLCGPGQFRWMYPFERFIGDLRNKCRQRTHPEATICAAYLQQLLIKQIPISIKEDAVKAHLIHVSILQENPFS